MNKKSVLFLLNANEGLSIELSNSLEQLDCCYRAYIFLFQKDTRTLLSDDTVHYNMERLSDRLTQGLYNSLELHSSITDDIGCLYNKYYQNESGFVMADLIGGSTWIGYKYHLWSVNTDQVTWVTWIYNDKHENIVFEVTPFYPYFFSDPEEESNYVSYEEWIKNYKPQLIRIIPREIAEQWLEQANKIVTQIAANIERWEQEEEEKKKD